MLIPHDQLSADALHGLIEEFVTRDGTDLSEAKASIDRIRRALQQGRAEIHFDEEEGTTTIVAVEPKARKRRDADE